jgi:hypothetical protein
VGESTAKQERRPDVQEDKGAPGVHGASPSGVAEEAHWVKPHQETDNGDPSVPGDLGHNVGEHKGGPVVSATFSFPVSKRLTMQCSRLEAYGVSYLDS